MKISREEFKCRFEQAAEENQQTWTSENENYQVWGMKKEKIEGKWTKPEWLIEKSSNGPTNTLWESQNKEAWEKESDYMKK